MKEIKEYTAEVFRRSEKRIKARRQRRNRILMACVPVVLCLTIFGAFLFPGVTPDGAADPGDGGVVMEGMGSDKHTSHSCSIAKITVSANGASKTCTDTENLMIILDRLQCPALEPPESNGISGEGDSDNGTDYKEHTDTSGALSDSSITLYTITLHPHEGDVTQYQLSANILKNVTTNETHTLSQNQVDELLKLLGLLP